MTNKEAIKNIVAYMYYADDIPEEVGKAFDVAIKALERSKNLEQSVVAENAISKTNQDLTKSNQGDLISREALKTLEYINKGNFNTVEGIREWIDNAPTVEITDYDTGYQDGLEDGLNDIRPQGEWKEHYGLYVCSECGQIIGEYKKNYCATCGASMRGGKE